MKILLIFLLPCSLSVLSNGNCGKTLIDSCIRADFPRALAHGIHALHLQELQYFFDSSAAEDNTIPVINSDLSSPDLVLPSVPDLKLNNTFLTPSMISVDFILSNWDNSNFFMKDASVLEMLVHNLHMYETLSVAGKIYRKLKKKVKNNDNNLLKRQVKKVCKCMKEVDGKLLTILENMAKSMRNSGGDNKDDRYIDNCYGWRSAEYNRHCNEIFAIDTMDTKWEWEWEKPFQRGNNKKCKNLVKHLTTPSINHHGHGNSIAVPPLIDSAAWKVWKSQLHVPDAQQWNYELATYIYCKLKM